MNKLFFLFWSVCALSMTGCLVPQVGKSSSEMRGRILDSKSGLPVSGARVVLADHPSTFGFSNESGIYAISATHKFGWLALGGCATSSITQYRDALDILHPEYVVARIYAIGHSRREGDIMYLEDILLEKRK